VAYLNQLENLAMVRSGNFDNMNLPNTKLSNFLTAYLFVGCVGILKSMLIFLGYELSVIVVHPLW